MKCGTPRCLVAVRDAGWGNDGFSGGRWSCCGVVVSSWASLGGRSITGGGGLAAGPVVWPVCRGLVVILPLVMASGCAHSLSAAQAMHAPSIARVERGSVASTVTATGTLHAMTTQSMWRRR